jgi:hypothetical protein
MPLRVANTDQLITTLRSAGYDATFRSSMVVVPSANGMSGYESRLASWLNEIVFVPNGTAMPDDEWQRLVLTVKEVARPVLMRFDREPVALSGASTSS